MLNVLQFHYDKSTGAVILVHGMNFLTDSFLSQFQKIFSYYFLRYCLSTSSSGLSSDIPIRDTCYGPQDTPIK